MVLAADVGLVRVEEDGDVLVKVVSHVGSDIVLHGGVVDMVVETRAVDARGIKTVVEVVVDLEV